ncbi:hypothetical protein CVT25_006099 [Psilocybe cyanescens]|uniref:Helicase C-terminal domain-containing protein n=1 Tax=Psilocybe cyanescens TaxID=93625 RepID=A0A409XQD2_PSICY|nr:hypothetical protein CVT25_006099 [Psilocybe cyanescens]
MSSSTGKTQVIHGAMTQMFLENEQAPWFYGPWQETTGIMHGLFPKDDSELPKGWTREIANSIHSYFEQFNQQKSQEDKIKFATARKNAAHIPGRIHWRKFITENWKRWGIHSKINAVLLEEGIHPLLYEDIHEATSRIPLVVDVVAQALFGEEALDSHLRVNSSIRRALRDIIKRTFNNTRNQITRSKSRTVSLEKGAVEAFEALLALDKDKATKAKIQAVILKLARWKALVDALRISDAMERVQHMEGELNELMLQFNPRVNVTSAKAKSGGAKLNTSALKSLASQEDIEDLVNLYEDFFNTPDPLDSVALQDQHPITALKVGGFDDGADLGVEVESKMTPEELARNLGFPPSRLPIPFNLYRHKGGITPWDSSHPNQIKPELAQNDSQMEPISLHWHQLAGVHALMRMNWTAKANTTRPCGALIADEVGLGKTFQAATVIAFLSDVAMRQKLSRPLPPLLFNTPFLGNSSTLPRLPSLILVPGTLIAQWETELKTIFKRGSVDILVYGTSKIQRIQFWDPKGPFHTSKNDVNKIIIAPHSALQQEFGALYFAPLKSVREPWKIPKRFPNYATNVKNTLYGYDYLSVTIDEAHVFRNTGAKHISLLALIERATLRFAMTATPLQTSTKDIAGMGRIVGIPYFLSQEATENEKSDLKELRQLKRCMDDETKEMESEAMMDFTKRTGQKMQMLFKDRILRRTTSSKDWRNQPLIDLPPYIDTPVILKVTEREMDIIREKADKMKKCVSSANGVLLVASRSFYVDHRISVGFARKSMSEKIPKFSSLDEWNELKSTKFDSCARMCVHLLGRDDAPELNVVDGKLVFPPLLPLEPGLQTQQTLKILISQEFPSLGPLLRNVLDLYGVKYLWIDGRMSFQQRAQVVKKFCTDSNIRVLIMSSVGSVGLNLTVASVIIFLDQPWSAQDELQIRGRAHRQPQQQTVRCYHLLADETADIILAALARGKHHMMAAFLKQEHGQELYSLLAGGTLNPPEDDYDEDDPKYMLDSEVNSKIKHRMKFIVDADQMIEDIDNSAKKEKSGKKAVKNPSVDGDRLNVVVVKQSKPRWKSMKSAEEVLDDNIVTESIQTAGQDTAAPPDRTVRPLQENSASVEIAVTTSLATPSVPSQETADNPDTDDPMLGNEGGNMEDGALNDDYDIPINESKSTATDPGDNVSTSCTGASHSSLSSPKTGTRRRATRM